MATMVVTVITVTCVAVLVTAVTVMVVTVVIMPVMTVACGATVGMNRVGLLITVVPVIVGFLVLVTVTILDRVALFLRRGVWGVA